MEVEELRTIHCIIMGYRAFAMDINARLQSPLHIPKPVRVRNHEIPSLGLTLWMTGGWIIESDPAYPH